MSNVIALTAWQSSHIPVRVSVFPLNTDLADVEIVTPDHATTITASRYDAATLLQRLEGSANPAAALAGFVEAYQRTGHET